MAPITSSTGRCSSAGKVWSQMSTAAQIRMTTINTNTRTRLCAIKKKPERKWELKFTGKEVGG